jgi:ATP-dependent Clp protease ATP-binding subunit ClpA
MFERFTSQARHAVDLARSEAIHLGTARIGCEHLLLGLAHGRSGAAAEALAAAGLDVGGLRDLAARTPPAEPLDADALAMLGIDLDQVRRAAEAAFGPGALDRPSRRGTGGARRVTMNAECRKALELALHAAQRGNDHALTSGHLLIGIIDQGDNGALQLLASAGADLTALRADTVRRMAAAA